MERGESGSEADLSLCGPALMGRVLDVRGGVVPRTEREDEARALEDSQVEGVNAP